MADSNAPAGLPDNLKEGFSKAAEGLKKIPSMMAAAVDDAKPHLINGVSALKDGYETAKPHVLSAIQASRPAVKAAGDAAAGAAAGAGNMVKQLAMAGKEGVGSMLLLQWRTADAAKELLQRGGEEAYAAVLAELADDAQFAELAVAYANSAKVAVAEKLLGESFLLASVDPTEDEIKVSLTATLDALGKEAKVRGAPPRGVSVDVEDAAPVTIMTAKITGLLTLGLVGSKPLTKPVVLGGDELAILSRYASDPKFGRLVLLELELEAAKHLAAKAVCDHFLLAVKSPTLAEIRMSLDATCGSLLKETRLPAKPPPLSKPLLTKTKGPGATAAVLQLFATSRTFDELAHAESMGGVEDFKKAYKSYHGEAAEMRAARNAARKLVDNFLLAAPDPTEEEVMMSLTTTIDVLTRLG